jgi:hypothetical protein
MDQDLRGGCTRAAGAVGSDFSDAETGMEIPEMADRDYRKPLPPVAVPGAAAPPAASQPDWGKPSIFDCGLFQLGLLPSANHNDWRVCGRLFSMDHKGFTASIEVTS